MIVTGAVFLLINAAMDFFVWPVFLFRRVLRDPRARDDRGDSTGFLRGHVFLIVVSALLGILSLIWGLILLLNPAFAHAG